MIEAAGAVRFPVPDKVEAYRAGNKGLSVCSWAR